MTGRGQYLQPEPILRSPNAQVACAYAGFSMPAYAYAGNNPLFFVDYDGRRFMNLTPDQRALIERLKSNPIIGDRVKFFDETKTMNIWLKEVPNYKRGATTAHPTHTSGASSCNTVIKYNLWSRRRFFETRSEWKAP